MTAESPTPHLPRGAGGQESRAAGRGSGAAGAAALVVEPYALARLLVGPALAELGFGPVTFAPPAGPDGGRGPTTAGPGDITTSAVILSLDRLPGCPRMHAGLARAAAGAPMVVGYGEGPPALLAAHRAHRCCDVVLRLGAVSGRPRLQHLPAVDVVSAAGLSVREADVLILLLRGLTTPGVAGHLGVSRSTARSHCRAVLRKLGVPDRRALRVALLGPGPQAPRVHDQAPGPQVCRPQGASFGEEWAVAMPPPALHT